MIVSMIGSNTNLIEEITDIVWMKDVSYLDACMEYCKIHNMEEEQLGVFIKKDSFLLAKLSEEAEELRLIPRSGAKLPL